MAPLGFGSAPDGGRRVSQLLALDIIIYMEKFFGGHRRSREVEPEPVTSQV